MDLNGSRILLLCILVHLVFATNRHIKKVIPDTKCNDTTTIPLVHVIASKEDAPNDAVHYIVCTLDRPTITIKHVLKKTKVTFNKTNLCNQSGEAFSFDQGGTSDLSGIIITKLYAYNDLKDTVVPDAGTQIDNDIMGDFKWQMDDSSDGKEMKFKGINAHSSITLIMNVHNEHGQGKEQPKNPINANLTEFRLELNNLTTDYKNTRYGIEAVFFSTSSDTTDEASHVKSQYIDDEYTPGIFSIWAVKFLPKLQGIKQTYVTWKPVFYNSPNWERKDQGLVKRYLRHDSSFTYEPLPNPFPKYSSGGIPWTVVGDMKPSYYGLNLSFGIPKDGFYNKNKYLSWSGMVGSGTPPVDEMSSRLKVTLAIGLGVPVVIIVAGVIFVMIRKIQTSTESSYDEIH